MPTSSPLLSRSSCRGALRRAARVRGGILLRPETKHALHLCIIHRRRQGLSPRSSDHCPRGFASFVDMDIGRQIDFNRPRQISTHAPLKTHVSLQASEENAHFTSRRGHCRHINRENAHFTSRKRPFRQSKFENAHFTSRKGHLRHVNLAKMHFLPEGTVIFVMFTLQNALFTARNGGFRHVNLAKCTFYFKER